MSTLKEQLKSAQEDVKEITEQTIPSSKVALPVPARAYPSSVEAYEAGIKFDNPTVRTYTTVRPQWRTPGAALQNNKVTTLNMPKVVVAKGIKQSPFSTASHLTSMPDMTAIVTAAAGVQVQVSWHFSGSLSTATAVASFALFREGTQIGPTTYGNSVANNGKFSVSQTFIDVPSVGLHAYSVYWATSAGSITADGVGRYLHALALKPQ
jgi:hypothetical protein